MKGSEIHKAMLARCEVLMLDDTPSPSDLAELEAIASACEAYENVVWPMSHPAHEKEAKSDG